MSEKIYSKLSRESRLIRLLELFPALDPASDIQCTLHEVPLGGHRPYKAVSYSWKEDDDTSQPFADVSLVRPQSYSGPNKFHEETITIPKNLSLVLRRLRLPYRSLTLWVDSLCINQVDNDERTHQVGMMSEIYQQASEVIIWLGERENEDELGEWLQGIFQRAEIQCTWYDDDRSRQEAEAYLRGFTSLESSWTGAIRPKRDVYGAFCLIWLLSQGKRSTEIKFYHAAFTNRFCMEWAAQVVQGLRTIMTRNWWRRSWVVQETVLARKATIHYGTISAPWTMFAKAAINYIKERSIEDLDRLNLYKGFNLYGAPVTGDALTDFSNTVLAIETTRSEWISQQPITLLPLLRRFRSRKASDDRDKVFALLGLVNKWISDPVLVNYNASMAQVYLETTVHIIRSTKSVSVLAGTLYESRAVDSGPNMPSWVTNWNIPAQEYEMERLGHLDLYSASGGKPGHAYLHGSSVLEVKGYLVGRIVLITPNAPESGLERLRRAISEWENTWQNYYCLKSSTPQSLLDDEHLHGQSAFWRTVCADALYVTPILKASGRHEGFYRRADNLGQAAFEAWKSDNRALRNRYTSIFGGNFTNSYVEPKQFSKTKNSFHYAVQSASSSRSLFSFERISGLHPLCACHIGIGPRDIQLGDYVCVVLGSSVPFILRRGNSHKCDCTPKEDLVSAQDTSNASIEICTEIHNNCFRVVGDAYVYGMMDSEAIISDVEPTSIFLV